MTEFSFIVTYPFKLKEQTEYKKLNPIVQVSAYYLTKGTGSVKTIEGII